MTKYDRWNAILEALAKDPRVDVRKAAGELGVSAATIRRDLAELAQQQMLTRTRSGAVAQSVAYDLPLRYKSARRTGAKERIAQAAAALVHPGAVVGLNGGTTTTATARAISLRPDLHPGHGGPGLTVVTNALNIANELVVRSHIKIVVIGGVARAQSYELIGPLAAAVLDGLSLDILFIGVDGFDAVAGATAQHEGEAAINAVMVSRARRVVVVADASKLGVQAFARICAMDKVDALVTDESAPAVALAKFLDAGVELICV